MNGFILDTDTRIEYFHGRRSVVEHTAATPTDKIFVSEVYIAELTHDALHSKAVEKHLRETQAIEETFTVLLLFGWTERYARMRNALTSKGIIVGDFDISIGVTAKQYGLTVATHNLKHFREMAEVECIEWVSK